MQASRTKTPASVTYRIVAILAVSTLLTACGYKGPLYMPPPPPQDSLTTPPQAPAPKQAPDDSNTATAIPLADQ